jgi:hypothetical protein
MSATHGTGTMVEGMRTIGWIVVTALAALTPGCGATAYHDALASNAAQGMYGYRYRPSDPDRQTIADGGIELQIGKLYSGNYAKDMLACVTVKNTGPTPQVFDSAAVQAVDQDTGITIFSVMKDKDTVTLPEHLPNVILRPTLEAGQKIKGTIYFPTGVNGGAARSFAIVYKGLRVPMGPRTTPTAEQLTSQQQAMVPECDR